MAACIRKISDSIISERLVHWLESSNIFPSNFLGFHIRSSSINAVRQLVLDIQLSFMNKEHFSFLFDVEAASLSFHLPTLAKILFEFGLPIHFSNYIILMYVNEQITISTISLLTRSLYKDLPLGFSLPPTLYNIYSLSFIPDTFGFIFIVFADDLMA